MRYNDYQAYCWSYIRYMNPTPKEHDHLVAYLRAHLRVYLRAHLRAHYGPIKLTTHPRDRQTARAATPKHGRRTAPLSHLVAVAHLLSRSVTTINK